MSHCVSIGLDITIPSLPMISLELHALGTHVSPEEDRKIIVLDRLALLLE